MKFINKIAGVTLLLFSIFSCNLNKENSDPNVEVSISGQQGDIKVVSRSEGQLFMTIGSERDWQISIEDKDRNSVSWLTLDKYAGKSVKSLSLTLSYTENKGVERTAYIIVSNAVKADTIIFTQQGLKKNDSTSGNNDNTSGSGGNTNNGSNDNTSGGNGNNNTTGGNTGNNDNTSGSGGNNGSNDNTSGGNTGGGDHTGNTPKEPEVPAGEHIHGDVTLIETPRLAGGPNNWYVSYRLSDGSVNYSLEWDNNWKLPRWVCFTFDRTNKGGRAGRTNAWGWDGIITPAREISRNWYPGGYDRGHMVASSDRQITREANEQTFYYTNMTPQLSGLNQQFWNEMERWVQDVARSSFNSDVMYVVKGVAFDGGKPQDWAYRKMAIPDYYYMAVVIKKNGRYNGLGMWVDHVAISRKEKSISDVVMTIDEVEKRAGVDLFHNLPDDIETKVESENPRSGFWPGV